MNPAHKRELTKTDLAAYLHRMNKRGGSFVVFTQAQRTTVLVMSDHWRIGGFIDWSVVSRKQDDGSFLISRVDHRRVDGA